MIDFLAHALRQRLSSLGFGASSDTKPCTLYSDMCAASDAVLLFAAPSNATVSLGKRIGSTLLGCYSLGLPQQRAAGFLYASGGFCSGESALFAREVVGSSSGSIGSGSEDGARWEVSGLDADAWDFSRSREVDTFGPENAALALSADLADARPPSESPAPSNAFHSILYGRLFEDCRLEALVAQNIGKDNLLVVSAISAWETDSHSHLEAQYIHNHKDWCADVSYSSTDNVLGASCLLKVPYTNWSAGAELIYTAAEKSGGISLGAKWVKVHERGVSSILTFLSNPMMGYMNTTYTATIRPDWIMSTSYDFNTYSYNSDLAVGVAYSPIDAKDRLFKMRFSMTEVSKRAGEASKNCHTPS
ncbi:Mitochondrial distribution and morphology protein 10 [Podochytrium sp. JEL0797]|nr:Mitochondrial distribution and morphology protein 10 [Podochytrium sp. JEL0797]